MSVELKTLRELLDAMREDLAVHYEGRVETVALFDELPFDDGQDRQAITTPALLIGVNGMDAAKEDGTERSPVKLIIGAFCLLSERTPRLELELREFAADLMQYVRFQRWGFPGAVMAPENVSSGAAEAVKEIVGTGAWMVSWEQTVMLGENVWAGGIAPEQIWLGFAPKIGAAHVDDYIRLADTSGLPL